MRHDQWNEVRDGIMQGAVKLTQAINQAEDIGERASTAGAALAAEVYRYARDPEGVGLVALREAYMTFMGHHSGGFRTTPELPDA